MFGSRWCDVALASERSADFSLALQLASSESMILVVQFLGMALKLEMFGVHFLMHTKVLVSNRGCRMKG